MARTLLTFLVALSLVGCTTLQPLPDAQPATIRDSVHAGDTIEIVKADGTKVSFKVSSVSDTTIQGADGDKTQGVAVADVRSISRRVMTTSDKVWTGVIAAVLVGGAAAAAGGGGGGGGSGY